MKATLKQLAAVHAICRFIDEHGHCPTVRDVAHALDDISVGAAFDRITAARRHKLLVDSAWKASTLQPTEAGRAAAMLAAPLFGDSQST